MKIGVHLGYWSAGPPQGVLDMVRAADDLGFDAIYSAEAYGSDALTPLAWWGSATSRVRLGSNVIQVSARTPTATAMAAMTMDHLSGGRFILGLGVSGPQVVEGWYGQRYPKPLARTREYVDIVRRTIAREVVTSAGPHYPLPLTGEGTTGLGKPLKSTLHPLRTDLPIFLGAEGPKNVALAAEIADGWLPLFFSPRSDDFYRTALEEGFGRAGARRTAADFEVHASVPVVIHDDVQLAAEPIRRNLALYIGGMGARGQNFHLDVFARMGWDQVCSQVQDLYLDGRKPEAAAAIPLELVDDVALVGPLGRVREQFSRWQPTVVTTLLVQGPTQAPDPVSYLRTVADALG